MNGELSVICISDVIEKNVYELWIKTATISGNETNINNDIAWVTTENSDWPNVIFSAKFDSADAPNKISDIVERIKKGEMPPFWTVGPTNTPLNLETILISTGFHQYYKQCGMAVDLNHISMSNQQQDTELEVKIVKELETLKQWVAVSNECFNENVSFEIFAKLHNEDDIEFYVGLYNGKVVATLLAYFALDVVGFHFVATLPAYRKWGLASLLVRTALNNALERNCKWAVLQASPMGKSLYQKIGFKRYFDINHYKLTNGS